MMTARQFRRALFVIATWLALGTAATAQPFAEPFTNTPAIEPFATEAIADAALREITGREDTYQQSSARHTAGVADNSVGDNVRTGDAKIDGSAFQNLSGLSVVNVNTGNNVAINAAMNVNIAINPAR